MTIHPHISPLEPFLSKTKAVEALHDLLRGSMGIDAIERVVDRAPYRIFPGGKRKHYRMSEVRPLFDDLMPLREPDSETEAGREESLHRRRRPKAS